MIGHPGFKDVTRDELVPMNTLTGIWVTGAVVSSLVVETIDHTTHHVDNCTRGYSHNSGGQPFASPDGTTNVDGTRILTEKYSRKHNHRRGISGNNIQHSRTSFGEYISARLAKRDDNTERSSGDDSALTLISSFVAESYRCYQHKL